MPDYLQLIGLALKAEGPPHCGRALLYAEVEDGVISASAFFERDEGDVAFRYASDELETLVYQFWEKGSDRVQPKSWRAIEYVVSGSKLSVDLTYQEQFNEAEGQHERRPRVVARHFSGSKVDFSQPDG